MPEGFVSVASFWSVEIARLAKIRLESEGINVELEGATTGTLAIAATGGVKLLVNESDFERAQTILNAEPDDQSIYEPTPEELAAEGIDVQLGPNNEVDEIAERDDSENDIRLNNNSNTPSVLWMLKVLVVTAVLLPVAIEILAFLAWVMSSIVPRPF